MRVFLIADVPKIGRSGEIIKVPDGYARNYLFPRNLAVMVTKENENSFKLRQKVLVKREEAIESATSLLAERIKETTITLKCKIHDSDKLYGSINASEIVDLLAQKGISISKNQVIFDKSIKKTGTYSITIKLSSRLQPACTLKVVAA